MRLRRRARLMEERSAKTSTRSAHLACGATGIGGMPARCAGDAEGGRAVLVARQGREAHFAALREMREPSGSTSARGSCADDLLDGDESSQRALADRSRGGILQ